MKLIIPMAGRGTRVRPHSHVTPKPLLHVKGKSMVERIIDTFSRVLPRALDEGVFILGPDFGDEVRVRLTEICKCNNMKAGFCVQDTAQGTGHAVWSAREFLAGEGIVVFADTLFDMPAVENLENKDVIIWVKHVDDPSAYGVAVSENGRIVRFVEKPAEPISNEALIGIYYVKDLSNLREATDYLVNNDIRGHGNEIELTAALDRMLNKNLFFTTAAVTDWLDCGTIPALLNTTAFILNKEKDDLRYGSVDNAVIIDPVYIGPEAIIRNSVVGPNVSVEAGGVIEGSVVSDSIVFANGEVNGAVLKKSLVGQHARVIKNPCALNIGDHSTVGT